MSENTFWKMPKCDTKIFNEIERIISVTKTELLSVVLDRVNTTLSKIVKDVTESSMNSNLRYLKGYKGFIGDALSFNSSKLQDTDYLQNTNLWRNKSKMDLVSARRSFRSPTHALDSFENLIIALDTTKSSTPYKLPHNKPTYTSSNIVLGNAGGGIIMEMDCNSNQLSHQEANANSDYIDLNDMALVGELDKEYRNLFIPNVFNSPNRRIEVVNNSLYNSPESKSLGMEHNSVIDFETPLLENDQGFQIVPGQVSMEDKTTQSNNVPIKQIVTSCTNYNSIDYLNDSKMKMFSNSGNSETFSFSDIKVIEPSSFFTTKTDQNIVPLISDQDLFSKRKINSLESALHNIFSGSDKLIQDHDLKDYNKLTETDEEVVLSDKFFRDKFLKSSLNNKRCDNLLAVSVTNNFDIINNNSKSNETHIHNIFEIRHDCIEDISSNKINKHYNSLSKICFLIYKPISVNASLIFNNLVCNTLNVSFKNDSIITGVNRIPDKFTLVLKMTSSNNISAKCKLNNSFNNLKFNSSGLFKCMDDIRKHINEIQNNNKDLFSLNVKSKPNGENKFKKYNVDSFNNQNLLQVPNVDSKIEQCCSFGDYVQLQVPTINVNAVSDHSLHNTLFCKNKDVSCTITSNEYNLCNSNLSQSNLSLTSRLQDEMQLDPSLNKGSNSCKLPIDQLLSSIDSDIQILTAVDCTNQPMKLMELNCTLDITSNSCENESLEKIISHQVPKLAPKQNPNLNPLIITDESILLIDEKLSSTVTTPSFIYSSSSQPTNSSSNSHSTKRFAESDISASNQNKRGRFVSATPETKPQDVKCLSSDVIKPPILEPKSLNIVDKRSSNISVKLSQKRRGVKRRARSDSLTNQNKKSKFLTENIKIQPLPTANESYIDQNEIADNNDPRWQLYNFSAPKDCFLSVYNQWSSMSMPNPHKDLTSRCYYNYPFNNVSTCKILGNEIKNNVECLSVYTKQLQDLDDKSIMIKSDLDKNGSSWSCRDIKRALNALQDSNDVQQQLELAWYEASRFYKYYKSPRSGYNPCFMSEYNFNEIQEILKTLKMYEEFYG